MSGLEGIHSMDLLQSRHVLEEIPILQDNN